MHGAVIELLVCIQRGDDGGVEFWHLMTTFILHIMETTVLLEVMMFMRGMLIGISVATACLSWLRWSRGLQDHPAQVAIPTTQLDTTRIAQRHAAIIAHITKESPWILNPSAKPSTNS